MGTDLRAYTRTLLKRKWWVVGVLLASIAIGVVLTARSTPMYRARTTLFVGERQFAIEQANEGLVVRNLSVGLLKSYVEIIKSRAIAQRAIVDGGLDASPGQVLGGLAAKDILETQVIEVTYQAADPARSEQTANAVAAAFVDEIRRLGARDIEGEPAVEVSVIDRAVAPTVPVSPNVPRNLTLALMLGLMTGIGLAYLVDHLDVSVKHRDDVEALGLPALGSIPVLETKGDEIFMASDAQSPAGEAFRKLRTSIGFINLETPTRSILVTSPLAQEGKTTTSLNLAAAYALGGLRTILVEADLRRPSLHRTFGMIGTRGLTTAIVGEVPLSEAVTHTEMRNLSVLVAGAIPPNPVELLGSDQMTEVLEDLARTYDIVIVDSPPIAPVADPAALAARCDGVVIVARAGKTDRQRLTDSTQVIQRAGGKVLGVVLNFMKPGDDPYEYDYYYGYRAGDRAMTARERA